MGLWAHGPMGPYGRRARGPGPGPRPGPTWASFSGNPSAKSARRKTTLVSRRSCDDFGPWAQNGPWVQMAPGPKPSLGPNGPWAQTGPKRALGPMGPGSKWAAPNGPNRPGRGYLQMSNSSALKRHPGKIGQSPLLGSWFSCCFFPGCRLNMGSLSYTQLPSGATVHAMCKSPQ